jgi:glyoxylase-like metal-dependent hydrolase (beta-lactamase superfamily II)/rhodanese-related sulfurtransferase
LLDENRKTIKSYRIKLTLLSSYTVSNHHNNIDRKNVDEDCNNNKSVEIKPADLKEKIDIGKDVFILDVRTTEEYASWHISYGRHRDPSLLPIDKLFGSPHEAVREIPKNKEIVTVCAHGIRSAMAAGLLNQLGYSAKSMSGGMSQWNSVYDIALIPVRPDSPVRIWQVRRISKGCIGYVIAPTNDAMATIIDPACQIDEAFNKIVKENNLQITNIVDTHLHADHVSAIHKLAKISNVNAYISQYEGYNIQNRDGLNFKLLKDGDKIQLGLGIFLESIHTPGHTNGSMSLLLETSEDDGSFSNDKNKKFLFAGDTLFIDGIGRSDLQDRPEQFGGILYDTYHEKFSRLSDSTIILPGHFNNSSMKLENRRSISDTLESIKKIVIPLSMDKEQFINFIAKAMPTRPSNYKKILEINKNLIGCNEILLGDLEAGPNSCAISV